MVMQIKLVVVVVVVVVVEVWVALGKSFHLCRLKTTKI